ncbi:MAG: hypothetical protein ACREL5_00285 [Gemmatimonadales bacterium]
MLIRVLEFSRAHTSTDASYAAVLQRLDDSITRAKALQLQERDGRTRERGAIERRRVQRRAIATRLQHLVRTARAAAIDDPALVGQFRLTEGRSPNRVFLTAAQSMLAFAQSNKDLLVQAGLGETLLDELTTAVDQFDAETTTSHQGRVDHVGARTDLEAVIGECMMDVGLLDGLNRTRFAADAELLGAWESVRNIPGPFRHTNTPEPEPAPAPTPPAVSEGGP